MVAQILIEKDSLVKLMKHCMLEMNPFHVLKLIKISIMPSKDQ